MEEKLLRTLRMQAWERAKGELHAVLSTYWGGYENDGQFKAMDARVKAFIDSVENDGLAE